MDQLPPYSFAAGSRPSHSGLCSLLPVLLLCIVRAKTHHYCFGGLGALIKHLCSMRLVCGDAPLGNPPVAWSLVESSSASTVANLVHPPKYLARASLIYIYHVDVWSPSAPNDTTRTINHADLLIKSFVLNLESRQILETRCAAGSAVFYFH